MDSEAFALLKTILGIDNLETSKDILLNFYITKAINGIMEYCVLTDPEYQAANLTNQTIELASYFYQSKKSLGLKDMTEGTRSKTYIEEAIPSSILVTLPLPNIILS